MLSGLENPLHLLVILLVVLLIFGGKRLPELGRSLGSGMRSFKSSVSGDDTPEHEIAPVADAPVAAERPSDSLHPRAAA